MFAKLTKIAKAKPFLFFVIFAIFRLRQGSGGPPELQRRLVANIVVPA